MTGTEQTLYLGRAKLQAVPNSKDVLAGRELAAKSTGKVSYMISLSDADRQMHEDGAEIYSPTNLNREASALQPRLAEKNRVGHFNQSRADVS